MTEDQDIFDDGGEARCADSWARWCNDCGHSWDERDSDFGFVREGKYADLDAVGHPRPCKVKGCDFYSSCPNCSRLHCIQHEKEFCL